jgi:hypothetical protein
MPERMSAGQGLPVRVYQTRDRIMLAAPMPGLEPGNISVHITDDQITIHGEERGPHQHERDLVLAEWSIGPLPLDGACSHIRSPPAPPRQSPLRAPRPAQGPSEGHRRRGTASRRSHVLATQQTGSVSRTPGVSRFVDRWISATSP